MKKKEIKDRYVVRTYSIHPYEIEAIKQAIIGTDDTLSGIIQLAFKNYIKNKNK